MKDLAIIEVGEASLVENNFLNGSQLNIILAPTPPQYIKKRPAKGGGTWDYVTGGYVRKVLNLAFGWDWDFEIVDEMIRDGEVVVKGRLTVRNGDRVVVKNQYGNKEIVKKKGMDQPLSIGNDLKAAATDALKKCAAELGIAADIYNKEDFKPVKVATDPIEKSKDVERVKAFIKRAKSVEQLNQVPEALLKSNQELSDLFELKLNELQ